jgi:hypothetical protein
MLEIIFLSHNYHTILMWQFQLTLKFLFIFLKLIQELVRIDGKIKI